MTLADELAAAPEEKEKPCPLCLILAAFPDEADAILALAAPGPGVTRRRAHLIEVMRKHNFSLSVSTMDRHLGGLRRGCPR